MTVEHLRTTVGPKVHGTWNLHDMLPKDLDFFVMLSSLAGVMGSYTICSPALPLT